jgi:hypothetical protein
VPGVLKPVLLNGTKPLPLQSDPLEHTHEPDNAGQASSTGLPHDAETPYGFSPAGTRTYTNLFPSKE